MIGKIGWFFMVIIRWLLMMFVRLGKLVGIKFNGDKNNMFDVLSGVRRKNSEGGGRGE
jgi:hypothetical protein